MANQYRWKKPGTPAAEKAAARLTGSPLSKIDVKREAWVIDGRVYYRDELPEGTHHPMPERPECVPIDHALLKSIRTPVVVAPHSSLKNEILTIGPGKPILKNGIPPRRVLTFTDCGIVLKDMYRVPVGEIGRRDVLPTGEELSRIRAIPAGILSLQKVFYREVIYTDGKDDDGNYKKLRTPGALLPYPMWGDWRPGRGIPVGSEKDGAHVRRWLSSFDNRTLRAVGEAKKILTRTPRGFVLKKDLERDPAHVLEVLE